MPFDISFRRSWRYDGMVDMQMGPFPGRPASERIISLTPGDVALLLERVTEFLTDATDEEE